MNIFLAVLMAISMSVPLLAQQRVILQEAGAQVVIPATQLAKGSFQITANDSAVSYRLMQRVAAYWETRPFLVYGTQGNWDMVPCETTSNAYWQQLNVIWRVLFGGTPTVASSSEITLPPYIHKVDQNMKGNDPFCDPNVIQKQQVFEGRRIRVIYNYAPIGSMHFLLVPKEHRKDFRELTEDEYSEAERLSQFVINKLKEQGPIHQTYLFHKTGKEAGQTVEHWHLHLIATENTQNDVLSKLQFLFRMTFGASPLPANTLAQRVAHYQKLLQ